jgi:hypothetical protein
VTRDPCLFAIDFFLPVISELTHFIVARLTERLLDVGGAREAAQLQATAAHGVECRHAPLLEVHYSVDDPPPVPRLEADLESPNFPTNVLFFGS